MDLRTWALALLAGLALAGCDNRGGAAGQPETRGPGAVMGASGGGTSEPASRSQTPPAGAGLNGGLGMTGSFPAGSSTQAGGDGSTNTTR
jgi:hypothetical protein